MDRKSEIKYFQKAVMIVMGRAIDEPTAEAAIKITELIRYKKGDTDLKSLCKIQVELEQKSRHYGK